MEIFVCDYILNIEFEKHIIRIENNEQLHTLLKNVEIASLKAAKIIKSKYKTIFDMELNISDYSLAVEILGHVYPGKFAEAIKSISSKVPMIGEKIGTLMEKLVLSHTDIIDCGEAFCDSNRWIWNMLSPFMNSIVKFLNKEEIETEK